MNNKKIIRNQFSFSKVFNLINSKLIDWDFEEVSGKGFIKKYTGHYGYIELKISKIQDSDQFSSHIESNLKDINELPFIDEIIKTLTFFIAYIGGIKGEEVNLKFEIIDLSFHKSESRITDFQIATLYAIVNCFDKNLFQISEENIKFIEQCKNEYPI